MVTGKIKYQGKPLIWPIPNKCTWHEGYFICYNDISYYCDDDFIEELQITLPAFKAAGINLVNKDESGRVKIVKSSAESDSGFYNYNIGFSSHIANRDGNGRMKNKDGEGYAINVTPENIIVEAKTKKGIFYALQTLIQLIENSDAAEELSNDNEKRMIPCVSIIDWPFKTVRGVHLYIPPREHLQWFKRYVDFLAKYKYNTIFLEVSAGIKYASHPEVNEGWIKFCDEMKAYPGGAVAMQREMGHAKNSSHVENAGGYYLEKWEVADLIEYINNRHIKIIPEMQSLSHSYWMLMSHPEFAELRTDPYPDTYCPSNPGVYELYFDCLQEIIDLFKPDTIHIGHDEFYTMGICKRCRDKTGHDILAQDILKIYNWLKERNIKMVMWGDKLTDFRYSDGRGTGGSELVRFNTKTRTSEKMRATFRAVDMIPSDITILDWYHTLGRYDTKSQDYFYPRGFDVIYGNFNAVRIRIGMINIEDRLRRPNVLGGEASLWYEVSDLGFAMADALVAYLDVANILWYEGYKFKYRPEYNRIIAQIYPMERDKMKADPRVSVNNANIKYIDISNLYNAPLKYINDCTFITKTEKIPNTVDFEICKNVKQCESEPASVIIGHGFGNYAEGINVKDKFRAIAFLHSYTTELKARNSW